MPELSQARELLDTASPDRPERLLLALEIAMNNEWWRGYFAGIDEAADKRSVK
jgi:hypothetical protein